MVIGMVDVERVWYHFKSICEDGLGGKAVRYDLGHGRYRFGCEEHWKPISEVTLIVDKRGGFTTLRIRKAPIKAGESGKVYEVDIHDTPDNVTCTGHYGVEVEERQVCEALDIKRGAYCRMEFENKPVPIWMELHTRNGKLEELSLEVG